MSESEFPATFRAITDYLESKDFNYSAYPEENRLSLTMSGKNANFRFTARITHGGDYLQIAAYYPFFVREEKQRPSVAELITRANYNMPLGKFEMDMKDGEVRFHITHVIGESGLHADMIEKHFMTAFFTADRYFPAFMQHIHAGYTPEDAVFHAELDVHAEQVEESPKKSRSKAKPKAAPSSPQAVKPPSKRASRKKPADPQGEGRDTPGGDLPL